MTDAGSSNIKYHKCNQMGQKQANCPQNQNQNPTPPNQNTNTQNNGKPSCIFCGKPNHTAENCFSNPNSQNFKGKKNNGNANTNGGSQNKQENPGVPAFDGYVFKSFTPTYNGEAPWCPICNSNDHSEAECDSLNLASHLRVSKLICSSCHLRGHTASECKHPAPASCAACHKYGHQAEECKDTIRHKLHFAGDHKTERFVWQDSDGFKIRPTQGQYLQHELEQELQRRYKQELQEDKPMRDLAWEEQAKQYVAENQAIRWPRQSEPLHHIPLTNFKSKPAPIQFRPSRITTPMSSRSCSVTSTRGTTSSSTAAWITNLARNTVPRDGLSQPQLAATLANLLGLEHPYVVTIVRRVQEELLSETHKAIRAKIDWSYRHYHKQNYNTMIQRLNCQIVERHVLSDDRLFEVKSAMAQGATFWHDPKAMDALARREKPVCHTCGRDGVIMDEYISIVPFEEVSSDAKKFLKAVKDYADWVLLLRLSARVVIKGIAGLSDCRRWEWWLRSSRLHDQILS